MEAPNFIQLLFILILLVGLYLIFTDSLTGRIKLAMIVVVMVVGLWLIVNSSYFKTYDELLSSPSTAKETYEVDCATLKPANGAYTMSTWIYVDDWNYNYGKNKYIFMKKKGDAGSNKPSMYFDKYSNDLHIRLETYSPDGATTNKEFIGSMKQKLKNAGVTEIDGVSIDDFAVECNPDGYVVAKAGDKQVVFDETNENGNVITCEPPITEVQHVVVDNVPLQKWVNITMSLNNRTMDVYMNGKLVKSSAFNNVINMSNFNSGTLELTPNGGYSGYIAHVRYYPEFITPQTAWDIYTSDIGGSLSTGNLSQYGMDVTIYQDDVEVNSYTVF